MNEILTKLRAELEAQPSPRTYEVARALTYLDSVDSETISSPSIERLEKVNEALVRALELIANTCPDERYWKIARDALAKEPA